jgi:general stress protein 26
MSEKSIKAEVELNGPGTKEELVKLLGEFRTAILVTRDDEGMPRARPLSIAKCDADGTVWFATSDHSPKVAELARDEHVAVICHRTRDEAWISMSCLATTVRDPNKVKELWDASMRAWFSGPEDPALVFIRVQPIHAEYYEPKKPFFIRPFSFVKGVITREPPRIGTTKHVELERLSDPGRASH